MVAVHQDDNSLPPGAEIKKALVNFPHSNPSSLLSVYGKRTFVDSTVNYWLGSSLGIANLYGLDGPGIESRWGARFSTHVQTGPEVHPASCTMGTGSFPGVKRAGRGVDHPPHLAPRLRKV